MSKKKLLCFTLSIIFFISLISFKQIIIKADVMNMPKFDVEMSVNPTSVVIGQDVTISGTIYPREFTLNSMPAKPRDIVVVVDRKVASNGDIIPLVEELKSFFKTIKDNYKYEGSRVGIIGYDKNATIYESSNNSLISLKNYAEIEKILNNLKSDVQGDKNKDNKYTNIGEALRKAEYLLHFSENNSKADKIIILIANNKAGARTSYINESDEGNYYTDITKEDYRNDKAQVYEGIDDRSFEYSKKIGETIKKNEDKIFTISYLETEKKKDVTEQLKELHESIIGKSVDNLTENEKSFFVTTDKNGGDIKKIFEEIDKQISQEYEIDDIQMNLEFNEGFSLDIGGNTVYLDNVIYKLVSNQDEIKNNIFKYEANPIDFEFKINPSNIGEEQELFSSMDITYTWQGKEIKQNIELSVPIKVNINADINYTGPDIRILEIEPADSFKLTDTSSKITTGIETVNRTENNEEYKIEITHMTMAEFIGKVDDLNGKYDVIVIGRYIDNNLNAPNGSVRYSNDKEGISWFRDYNDLENDITNKKANEIKEFINSGQLVYIDSQIADTSAYKLRYHFSDTNGYFNQNVDNLIKDKTINDENGITITNIIKKYFERINKNSALIRSNIVSTSPNGDTQDDELGDIAKRNMVFNVASNEQQDENVNINLYLDINGDGLFKEEEIVKEVKGVNLSKGVYTLEYNIYEDYPMFIGYLNWRIEVVKNIIDGYTEPIKSYCDGNVLFRRLTEEKRVINVLQISPFDRWSLVATSAQGTGGNLNLATNTQFQNLLKEKEVQDYEIQIDVISYKDFYNGNYEGPGRENLNDSKYDMIVMGFADTNESEYISNEGVNQLKDYISVGKSLMLTHDTLFYPRNPDFSWGYNIREKSLLMKVFRDVVGQSRYIDPNNSSELDFNGEKIEHDPNGWTVNNSYNADEYKKEAGATFLDRGLGSWDTNSTVVYKVNESILTNYPFNLGTEIRVRKTHGQYLQLNFEDEDVVPLFNLTEIDTKEQWWTSYNKNNRYDSRNFYYTYSRGNITFSGTGENGREWNEYPLEEMQLFVNTIVKAERSANHKPQISGLENTYEIPYNSDFNFNLIVKDIDKDKVKINKILLNGNKLNLNNIPTGLKESGSIFSVVIDSTLLTLNNEMKITIEAEDEKGAKSTKEYTIKPVGNPLIKSQSKEINLVVNEEKSFEIKLERENDSNPSSITIDKISIPKGNGIYNLNSVEIKNIGEDIYLVGKITSLIKSSGEEIPIIINYKTNDFTSKQTEIKLILNSVNLDVKVILKGSQTNENLGISPNIKLTNSELNKVYSNNINPISGELNFESINSGKYRMSISNLDGYKIQSISINGEKASLIQNQYIDFNLSFEENLKVVEILATQESFNLSHGLYQGLNESGSVDIEEKDEGFEIAVGSTVNFGSVFTLNGSNPKINLKIASNLDSSNNNIKIYNIKNGKLEEISEEVLDIIQDKTNYIITIKDTFIDNSKILILYSAKVPNKSENEEFINTIEVNGFSKDVKIYTNPNENQSLPDLF